MKKYDTYKDSGIEWLGEIPEHWNIIKLKWLTSVKRGASPRPIADTKYFDENGDFAWVRISDVTASGRYLEKTTERLSELGVSLSVKQYPGDLFLSIAGSVGKPIITKIKCCIHDGFVWFPDLKINSEFLYYLFQTGLPFGGLGKIGTQLNLNTETIGGIVIPYLSNLDYSAIVSFLDHKTTQIDTIIEKKEQLVEKLTLKRQAIINEAVTKGLNPNAPMKDSGIEWLGEIPKHWEIQQLKRVVTCNDETLPENTDKEQYIKYIEIGSVSLEKGIEQYDTLLFSEAPSRARRIVRKNDVIISTVRTYLKAITQINDNYDGFIVSTGFAVLRPNQITSSFLGAVVCCENFVDEVISRSVGVSYPAINASDLINIEIPFPSQKEQNEITTYIEGKTNKIDIAIIKINASIERLKLYRQSLISEAVTGKIDLRDWRKPENN